MRRSPATTTPDLPAGTLETDAVAVRALRAEDLATIVRIDARIVGRPRGTCFLHARGFALAPRLCLTRRLDGADA